MHFRLPYSYKYLNEKQFDTILRTVSEDWLL